MKYPQLVPMAVHWGTSGSWYGNMILSTFSSLTRLFLALVLTQMVRLSLPPHKVALKGANGGLAATSKM